MAHNFIIFGLSSWNIEIGCNIKDISIELVNQGHKVLYIDVPLKRKEAWFMKEKPEVKLVKERTQQKKNLIELSPNLWHYVTSDVLESVNSISNNFVFDGLNYINNKRFAKIIKRAASEAGFSEYILLNDNDVYNGLHLNKLVSPRRYVYYLRDKLSAFKYWKRQVSRLEPELIRRAGVVVANSEYLSNYASEFNRNSHYVGQGCDIRSYLMKPTQNEIDFVLKDFTRPLIGYVGALNAERLDIDLIYQIAGRLPEMSFVFVGPEDQAFQSSQLHQLKNVYFLGRKELADLPKFIYGFNVAINPQVLNEITIGNYPRKIDEYLAVGVPVVATATDAMRPFAEHVLLGKTPDEYCHLIRKALQENNETIRKKRVNFASEHTWQRSVNDILNVI